jgi:hypothetical protein
MVSLIRSKYWRIRLAYFLPYAAILTVAGDFASISTAVSRRQKWLLTKNLLKIRRCFGILINSEAFAKVLNDVDQSMTQMLPITCNGRLTSIQLQ